MGLDNVIPDRLPLIQTDQQTKPEPTQMTNLNKACQIVTTGILITIALIVTIIKLTNIEEDKTLAAKVTAMIANPVEDPWGDEELTEIENWVSMLRTGDWGTDVEDPWVDEELTETDDAFVVSPSAVLTALAVMPWNDLRAYAKATYNLTTNNKSLLLSQIADRLG